MKLWSQYRKIKEGELFSENTVLDEGKVTHWLEFPAIPRDSN